MSDLPGPELRSLIHPHTGDVTAVQATRRGFSSDVTAFVEGAHGRFFVKAMKNRPGGRLNSLRREQLINPALHGICPDLIWSAEDSAWCALGFDYVEGRHSDIDPGSRDLPVITGLIERIGRLELPAVARDWPETRWNRFAGSNSDAERFTGDTLLYTDIHASNIIIGNVRVWAVDWSWPTRGAAFIDPACLVVQLVAAGHSPKDAESWAERCTAWLEADPVAVDAFAAATVRMYRAFAQRDPAQWRQAMVTAVEAWAEHRNVPVPAAPDGDTSG